ncbi:Prefoldin subunit 3, partial [Mycena vulgaris]
MSHTTNAEERNPRGIPKAPFIADVEEHVGGPTGEDALAKYRFMDNNLAQRRAGLEDKIPDIKKTLMMVEFLQERRVCALFTSSDGVSRSSLQGEKSKAADDDDLDADDDLEEEGSQKPLTTTFELNDTLYAEAELEDTDTVYLWLGANVMLSYKIPAAITLKSKLEAAETSLKNAIEDLEFLREQITVMERKREKREREQASNLATAKSAAGG